jgi:hypothetical protein
MRGWVIFSAEMYAENAEIATTWHVAARLLERRLGRRAPCPGRREQRVQWWRGLRASIARDYLLLVSALRISMIVGMYQSISARSSDRL